MSRKKLCELALALSSLYRSQSQSADGQWMRTNINAARITATAEFDVALADLVASTATADATFARRANQVRSRSDPHQPPVQHHSVQAAPTASFHSPVHTTPVYYRAVRQPNHKPPVYSRAVRQPYLNPGIMKLTAQAVPAQPATRHTPPYTDVPHPAPAPPRPLAAASRSKKSRRMLCELALALSALCRSQATSADGQWMRTTTNAARITATSEFDVALANLVASTATADATLARRAIQVRSRSDPHQPPVQHHSVQAAPTASFHSPCTPACNLASSQNGTGRPAACAASHRQCCSCSFTPLACAHDCCCSAQSDLHRPPVQHHSV